MNTDRKVHDWQTVSDQLARVNQAAEATQEALLDHQRARNALPGTRGIPLPPYSSPPPARHAVFGVTNYYICTSCGKPCDRYIENRPYWQAQAILSACHSAPVRVESAKEGS